MTTDRVTAIYEALGELQGTAYHLPPGTRQAIAEHLARVLSAAVPVPPPTNRAAKAEALLLHFTAEAHRRKWSYDRGLDDDGVPIKSEAFDALHRLGDEMNAELHKLRRVAAEEQPAETQAPEPETEEQRVRAHVTTLHLIGEQLAGIESWMWEHLADVRDAEERPVVGEQPDTQTREA